MKICFISSAKSFVHVSILFQRQILLVLNVGFRFSQPLLVIIIHVQYCVTKDECIAEEIIIEMLSPRTVTYLLPKVEKKY